MARHISIKCDGCGKEHESGGDAWLSLANHPEVGMLTGVRLEDRRYFCGLICLQTWTVKALKAAEDMVAMADSLHPRGLFGDGEGLGLCY